MNLLLDGDIKSGHSVEIHFSHLAVALSKFANVNVRFSNSPRHWPIEDLGYKTNDIDILDSFLSQKPTPCFDHDLLLSIKGPIPNNRKLMFYQFSLEFQSDRPDLLSLLSESCQFIVPSIWCRNILLASGCHPSFVHCINEGVNTEYFFPHTVDSILSFRDSLAISRTSFVFLNVSALTFNKGIDLLLSSFQDFLLSSAVDALLVIKDLSHVYELSAKSVLERSLALGQISELTASRIVIVSGRITFADLNILYNIADCYVSPYRAEGFNAPVLQSIAASTPVIVTEGGATDDFVTSLHGWKIESEPMAFSSDAVGLMPSQKHLTHLLSVAYVTNLKRDQSFLKACALSSNHFCYPRVAGRYLDLFYSAITNFSESNVM
jgi:glycosyltransferase involved in cell wall biosynthesis